jgi:hypothetical protein
MLLILRPFRAGEYIQAAGRSGTVREIGMFTTILIGHDFAYVSVPNSAIFGRVIVNNSREPFKLINITVSIDYSNDVDAAQKIILDVPNSDRHALKSPPPTTGIAALREYSIDPVVRCAVVNADTEPTLFAIQKEIKNRFHGQVSRFRPADRPLPNGIGRPRTARHNKCHIDLPSLNVDWRLRAGRNYDRFRGGEHGPSLLRIEGALRRGGSGWRGILQQRGMPAPDDGGKFPLPGRGIGRSPNARCRLEACPQHRAAAFPPARASLA